jgi:flagellar basal body-associated protein FliL
MKRIKNFTKTFLIFRILILLLLLMAGILIAGTIYGIARPGDSGPLFTIGTSPVPGDSGRLGEAPTNEEVSVFTGIGRLRIPLANSATLILSVAFPYPVDDRAFTEELALKIGDFRDIARDYFSSLPPEKLINLDEDAAKTEILRRYNTGLRLGKIQALYFNDLIMLE